jgi:hypothetical protein
MPDNKNQKNEKDLEKGLDQFLNKKNKEVECEGDECIINDGKEIVERVNKVYKTTDGRQLLM